MNKIQMKVVNIEEQETPNGEVHLHITVKSGENIYTFGVKEEDYLDEKIRKGMHQRWIKKIKKLQTRKNRTEAEEGTRTRKIKDIIGTEVEEVVY